MLAVLVQRYNLCVQRDVRFSYMTTVSKASNNSKLIIARRKCRYGLQYVTENDSS